MLETSYDKKRGSEDPYNTLYMLGANGDFPDEYYDALPTVIKFRQDEIDYIEAVTDYLEENKAGDWKRFVKSDENLKRYIVLCMFSKLSVEQAAEELSWKVSDILTNRNSFERVTGVDSSGTVDYSHDKKFESNFDKKSLKILVESIRGIPTAFRQTIEDVFEMLCGKN